MTNYYSVLSTQHSVLTTQHLVLTTLTIHYSPLTSHYAPLTSHSPLLTLHYSLLNNDQLLLKCKQHCVDSTQFPHLTKAYNLSFFLFFFLSLFRKMCHLVTFRSKVWESDIGTFPPLELSRTRIVWRTSFHARSSTNV